MRILIFGDSIAQGFFDPAGGWTTRLANEVHQESLGGMLSTPGYDTIEVFNLGISGDMAEDVLERLEAEVKARRWKTDPITIILAVGINDARQVANRAEVDEYDFQQTYEKLLDKAADLAEAVLCIGLSAVDESQTNPWPYSSTGAQWSNTRINLFEDIIKQSAIRKEVPFVPVHDEFQTRLQVGEALLSDGLHPNEAGHTLILEKVRPGLPKQ